MTYGAGSVTRTPAGKFRVRIPNGKGGKLTVGTYPTEEHAERMRAAALLEHAELDTGITFADYGARWLDRCEVEGQKSNGSNRSLWRQVISQADFYEDPVEMIGRADIKRWIVELRGHITTRGTPISRQQAKHALGQVSRCLEAARLDDGLIESNPATGVKLWREQRTADGWTFLDAAEVDQLLACPALPAMQRAVYATGIYAGLRQGELFGLSWPDVFLEDRPRLEVRRSWGGATKSGKPRMVPVLPALGEVLRRWWVLSGRPKTGPVFARVATRRGVVTGRHHFAKGYDAAWADVPELGRARPYTRLGWRRIAGVAREVRFHDLRHSCASHLAMGTWGRVWRLDEIRDLLGHTDIKVTQRYAHLCPAGLLGAAAATTQQDPNRTSGVALDAAQIAGIIGRAMQDSNLRPSAPEAEASATIPRSLPRSSPVCVLSSADEVLRAVAGGETVPDEQLLDLARAVLGLALVQRAAALLEGDVRDPRRLVMGVGLAAAVAADLGRIEVASGEAGER